MPYDRPTPPALLATIALILGGIGIGITEFVTMGLLPQIAQGLHASIPQAGHAISACAVGVVVGAPVLAAWGAPRPRQGLLLGLALAIVVGNALSALAPTYETLLVARVMAGLPHGAYFGVASLVAIDQLGDDAQRLVLARPPPPCAAGCCQQAPVRIIQSQLRRDAHFQVLPPCGHGRKVETGCTRIRPGTWPDMRGTSVGTFV